VERLAAELGAVHEALWEAEEGLRACDRSGEFGARYVELARSARRYEDERAMLVRRIDELLGWRPEAGLRPADAAG
jgi:hypothetical protein